MNPTRKFPDGMYASVFFSLDIHLNKKCLNDTPLNFNQ